MKKFITFTQILELMRDVFGCNDKDAGEYIGVSQSQISNARIGKRYIKKQQIEKALLSELLIVLADRGNAEKPYSKKAIVKHLKCNGLLYPDIEEVAEKEYIDVVIAIMNHYPLSQEEAKAIAYDSSLVGEDNNNSPAEFMSCANKGIKGLPAESLRKNSFSYSKKLSKIHYSDEKNPNNILEMIKQAKSNIFISGVGMQHINDIRKIFYNIGSNVKITFAIQNYDDNVVMTTIKNIFWRTDEEWIERRTNFEIGKRKINNERGKEYEIKIITLDTFIPIALLAVDYDTNISSSFINVGSYLLSTKKSKAERYSFVLRPEDGEIYNDYREQILLIEKHKGFLANRLDTKSSKIQVKNDGNDIIFESYKPVMKYYTQKLKTIEMIKQAKDSIFISGVTMKQVHDLRHELSDVAKKNVAITLAVQDYDDINVITFYKNFFGKSDKYFKNCKGTVDDGVERIKQISGCSVKIIPLDILNPIGYFAVDYKYVIESSIITVSYYLLPVEEPQVGDCKVHHSFRPGMDLYEEHREQILLIEFLQGKLSNRFNEWDYNKFIEYKEKLDKTFQENESTDN